MQETTENAFVISFVKVGAIQLCGFCGGGADIEGRGVAIVDGPVAVTMGKGKPVCRGCLKEKDPAFLAEFLKVRHKEDIAEKDVISGEYQERYQRCADLQKEIPAAHRELAKEKERFFEEVRKAVLAHPLHLAARRLEFTRRQEVIPALEAQAALAKALYATGAIAPKDRPQAETKLSASAEAVNQARQRVAQAEDAVARVYAALLQEMTGQANAKP